MKNVVRPSAVSDMNGTYGPEIYFDPQGCETWPNGVWMCGIPEQDHFEGASPDEAFYAWEFVYSHSRNESSEVKLNRNLTNDANYGCDPKNFSNTQEHKSLRVVSLDRAQHGRTCGYWYLVQANVMAHTAFAERDHFLTYLEDRGLRLLDVLPEHTCYGGVSIEGTYRTTMHMSYDQFYSIRGKRIRTLSNGEYTLGIIAQDEDGVFNVHSLNPNMRDRIVFDHAESRAMVG